MSPRSYVRPSESMIAISLRPDDRSRASSTCSQVTTIPDATKNPVPAFLPSIWIRTAHLSSSSRATASETLASPSAIARPALGFEVGSHRVDQIVADLRDALRVLLVRAAGLRGEGSVRGRAHPVVLHLLELLQQPCGHFPHVGAPRQDQQVVDAVEAGEPALVILVLELG